MREDGPRMVFLVRATAVASLFRSMRTAFMVGVWLAASSAGCAHSRPEPATPASTVEPAIARLRQENNALKRRVQMLEDRVLMMEGGPQQGTQASADSSLRNLPVVRLEPNRGRAETPRAHAASPAPAVGRRSRSLDPLPHSGEPVDPMAEEEPSGWHGTDEAWSDGGSSSARSYRLVGAHLVEQTKSKGPTRPDRPSRDARGREILAEYEAAMATYKSGAFVEAERAFDAFARAHPDHDYADNALYWKGEAAYDQHHYADALAAFTEVVERYGGGNKAPDALLKIGLCYEKVEDLENARDVLTQLVAAYPRARASDIARARLVELGA
jgi:tol-pal system protein YbgF